MRQFIGDFLERRLSRRDLLQALAAAGVSAAGREFIAQAAEAADQGVGAAGRLVTGTGGELMVEQMKAAGVKFVFTNPGSFEVGFFDAFLDQPGMHLILGLHEGIVIAMADGYHKVSREPAFVNVHVIAGTAQAAGQLYNASRDGSALVVTAGLLDNERFSDDILLGPRPGFDQKEINRQFTKISWESHEAAGIPIMLRRAFKMALTAPTGPVYLAMPDYVLEQKAVTAMIFDRPHFLIPDDIPPKQQLVEQLAERLLAARSPVLNVGSEVTKARAQGDALELAELLRVPVCDAGSLAAFHNFPRRHPLFAGRLSSKGKDLVIHCGATDTGSGAPAGSPTSDYDEGTTVACISLNTDAVGRTHPFDLVLVANVKLTLRALIDAVKARATAERLAKIAADRELPTRPTPGPTRDRVGLAPIHPDELAWALEHELDRDAIIVSENLTGSHHFFSTGFRENEKMWVSNSGAGLGWGVGAATGAKLAAPDRQVVCDIGDGSVMYSAAGFWSQARYGVPVLTVVSNNRNYQTVRYAYARYDGKMAKANQYLGLYLGDPDIDFVKLAQSQGADGVRVERSADLIPALRRGIAATRAGQPFLIDVAVQRTGPGADSTWHQEFSLAGMRKRKV
jgi:benzoylformate decarboxylase